MRGILSVLHSDTEVAAALSDSSKIIAPASSYPFLIALAAQEKPLLIVTSSSRGSEDLTEYLKSLHSTVYEFPAWETLPHERLSPRSDTVARRLSTLYSLTENPINPIVVAPVRAAIHRFIATLAKSPLWTLEIGQEIGLTELITHLTELAFTRTDLVEKRGEFAVRGGIVDVFLPLAMHPVRIDFFGDEIEEMRYFEVADQRTSEAVVGKLAILPCRELLLTESIRERAEKIKSQYPSALEILDKVAQGTIVDGMESLIPLLTDDFETILDRMPKGTQVIFIDDERIRSRTADLIETNQEFLEASWSNAAIGGSAPLPVKNITYFDWKELQDEIARLALPVRALNAFG
ncbi:MAG: transcription-repair coupling factor, partial [Actinobacteria bacterium]|nr:transcription-repair coupling factor [Actinomycetota bacterium]